MMTPTKGNLLIASPFLKDTHFLRSVIYLCEQNAQGSFGLVLNQTYPVKLNKILPEMDDIYFPVYIGGPVEENTLHFLHQSPDLISGGEEISNGIYWGGNFESVQILLKNNELNPNKIKFFMGYSGWAAGQLEQEWQEKTWVTGRATRKLIFSTVAKNIWSESLKELGGEYQQMIHYPLDPQLN